MDFRTLAAQHSETIDELNSRLTARDKELGKLKYRLAELSEQSRPNSSTGESAAQEAEADKLRTKLQTANGRCKDLEVKLQAFETQAEDDRHRFSQVEADLKQKITTLQSIIATNTYNGSDQERLQQELDNMRIQRDKANRNLASLQRQFEQEKKANRKRELGHDMQKEINRNDYDEDDEEPRLPGYPPPPRPPAPAFRPSPEASTTRRKSASSSASPSLGYGTFASSVAPTLEKQPRPFLAKSSAPPAPSSTFRLLNIPDIPGPPNGLGNNGLLTLGLTPATSQCSSSTSTIGWNQNFSFTAPATRKAQVPHQAPSPIQTSTIENVTKSPAVRPAPNHVAKTQLPEERPSFVVTLATDRRKQSIPRTSAAARSPAIANLTEQPAPEPDSSIAFGPLEQSKKRKRLLTRKEQLEEEVRELRSSSFNEVLDGPSSAKRLRSSRTNSSTSSFSLPSYSSTSTHSTKNSSGATTPADPDLEFTFIAVTTYDHEGSVSGHYLSSDISNELADLWDAINKVKDDWEDKKGADWQWEFKKPGYNFALKPCVTRKLGGKRTNWRKGCEGIYACKDCVAANLPCFTFWGEEDEGVEEWKFWLLPLHEEDRKLPVEEGFEIRYWLNS